MATLFSDHFGTTTANTSLPLAPQRVSAGISHGRVHYKKATITIPIGGTGGTAADIWRLMTFRSGDRPHAVYYSTIGTGGNGAGNLGLYKAGGNHDGALLDADLFGAAIAITGAVTRTEVFTQSTNLVNTDRGKTLWELADIGAATYTANPMENWDLGFTITTTTTVAIAIVTFEVLYTAGD